MFNWLTSLAFNYMTLTSVVVVSDQLPGNTPLNVFGFCKRLKGNV